MSDSMLQTKNHLPQLDGIRGIAILMVLVYHFIAISPLPINSFEKFVFICAKTGWFGVDLFFVLSGFLITGILISSKDSERYFVNFYVRRILRIFPLYYLVLFIFFVVVPFTVVNLPNQLRLMQDNQIWFWTYLANWYVAIGGDFNKTSGGYFWSLAVEEQFYIIWPFIVYKLSTTTFRKFCIALFISSFFLRNLLLLYGVSTTSTYAATITHMDGLLIGSWLSTVCVESDYIARIKPLLNRTVLITITLLVIIFVYQQTFYFWDPIVAGVGYSLLAILFAAILIGCVVNKHHKLNSVFNNNYLRNIGKYSYAMYLIHVPVSRGLRNTFYTSEYINYLPLLFRWTFFVISASVITYLLAYISWHCFEKHFLKLKIYFESKKRV